MPASCLHRLPALILAGLAAGLIASAVLTPPTAVHASADSIRQGSELYANTGCVHCHGPARQGTDRGPDLSNLRSRRSATFISTQIHNGGQSMPPFGEQLSPKDIADLVDFLRTKARK